MTYSRESLMTIVIAIVAFLLQIIVAPYIVVFGAMPNFIIVWVLLCALVRHDVFGSVFPFVCGLLFDLMSGGPVGPMAFCLTLFSVCAARVFSAMDNDTVFMPLVIGIVSALLIEFVYCLFLLGFGYNSSFLDALGLRVLPCTLYDIVFIILFYPLAVRLLSPPNPVQPDITQLR